MVRESHMTSGLKAIGDTEIRTLALGHLGSKVERCGSTTRRSGHSGHLGTIDSPIAAPRLPCESGN